MRRVSFLLIIFLNIVLVSHLFPQTGDYQKIELAGNWGITGLADSIILSKSFSKHIKMLGDVSELFFYPNIGKDSIIIVFGHHETEGTDALRPVSDNGIEKLLAYNSFERKESITGEITLDTIKGKPLLKYKSFRDSSVTLFEKLDNNATLNNGGLEYYARKYLLAGQYTIQDSKIKNSIGKSIVFYEDGKIEGIEDYDIYNVILDPLEYYKLKDKDLMTFRSTRKEKYRTNPPVLCAWEIENDLLFVYNIMESAGNTFKYEMWYKLMKNK